MMFSLLPWRWAHWLLLLAGGLFVAFYLNLLTWPPVVAVTEPLQRRPPDAEKAFSLIHAESIMGIVTLLLLTPLALMVVLFILTLAWVGLAGTLGSLARALGLPEWSLTLLAAAASAGALYANSGAWLPWAVSVVDRLTSAYLLPLL